MFLNEPGGAEAAAYLEKDREASGYVMNLERAWAWRPDVAQGFAHLRRQLLERTRLMPTEIALLACSAARALGDSYCSLAWGTKLAGMRGTEAVTAVLHGLDPPASWRSSKRRCTSRSGSHSRLSARRSERSPIASS